MRSFLFLLCSILIFQTSPAQKPDQKPDQKLFIYGGQVNQEFVKYTAQLTGKKNPKICFLPTATGDRESYIVFWFQLCAELEVRPYVQRVWISSYSQTESFEKVLCGMDAIVVGGGNTLNMLAIWKAQKIDLALRKAYQQGVVLAGGSAGSLCWFKGGTTDSRPEVLSIVEGLGLLPFSHCPHYHSEASRRPLYHDNILSGKLGDGYACDDKAGILFVNGKAEKAVALDPESNSWFVYKQEGQSGGYQIVEEMLEAEIIR